MSALASRVSTADLSELEQAAVELREAGVGYLDIALELGVERAEVAGLLASARLRLRAAVRPAALPPASGEECERVLPLLSARQDGERIAAADREFLKAHVDGCEHCRATRMALREGTLALRAALELGPVAFGAPVAPLVPVAEPVAPPAPAPAPAAPARRRRAPALAAAAAVAACVATFATIFVGGDDPQRSSAAEPGATPTATASPEPTTDPAIAQRRRERAAAARRRKAAARRRAAAARRRQAAAATAAPAATYEAPPQPTATPAPEKKQAVAEEEDDAETQSGQRGAGIPQPSATPGPDTVIPDSCTEDNPDCESG